MFRNSLVLRPTFRYCTEVDQCKNYPTKSTVIGNYLHRRPSSTQAPQSESSESPWLHRLNETQESFLWGHRNGTRFGLFRITLNSKKPLSSDVVQQTLLHWQRKSPILPVVIREHEGGMWFYNRQYIDLDFKVCAKSTPILDVMDDCFSGFDEFNGPLWKSILLPIEEGSPCPVPEVQKTYPHQYELYLSLHHSMMDGRTLLGLTQPILDILNDVIEGNEIDSSPLGIFPSNEDYGKAYRMIREKLMTDPERMEKLKAFILKSNKSPLLQKVFPRQQDVINPRTRHFFVDLDKDLIAKFRVKCKSNGITFGSGMQTVANTVLVELAQEAGVTDDTYDLSANFTIDLRRYMQPSEVLIHGCHAQTMASVITLDKNVRDNFWKNSRAMHEVNLDLIKGGKVIEQAIGRQLFLQEPPPHEFFSGCPEMTRDYALNNIRRIDLLIHGRGKHVQLTDIIGVNAIQRYIFPFMLMLYEYRDNTKAMISYANDCLTEENAKLIANRIKLLMQYYTIE